MECLRCFFDLPVETEDTVCPNCGRSYSYTANIYLGLLALAQLILAWSVRYLLTLEISPLTKPAGELADWCIWPVSIIDVPAQIPVLGGLLALLAVAPILTAILFGKRGGWLLAVITFALGPSMIFGAVLMLSSWIAGGRTCRMRSKLVSGLTALLPVIIYWFVSSIPPENLPLARALHGAVYVPAFFATVISVALVSALVVVGRLTRFDVRASVLPTVALMAGGIIAFLSFVGREEIEIAMLDRDFGFEEYVIDHGALRLPDGVRVRLEKFSSEFPKARRAGEVAYVLARDLDAAARGPDGQPRSDMREAAVGRWRKLARISPQPRFAIDARLALGRIHAAEGKPKIARPFYVAATDSCKDLKANGGDLLSDFSLLTGLWSIGERLRARRSVQYRLDRCARGWRELALLEENSDCPLCGGRDFRQFAGAAAMRGTPTFEGLLLRIQKTCAEGKLADNVAYELAWLKGEPHERLRALEEVAKLWPRSDGALLSLYDMAVLEGQLANKGEPELLRSALQHLKEVLLLIDGRRRADPDDTYARLFETLVRDRTLYLEAQLAKPEEPVE